MHFGVGRHRPTTLYSRSWTNTKDSLREHLRAAGPRPATGRHRCQRSGTSRERLTAQADSLAGPAVPSADHGPLPREARPPHASGESSTAAMFAARLPRGPGMAAQKPLSSAASPRRRLPRAASTSVSAPVPAVPPAPRPSLTVPDAFMVLPPPRPAGKERPNTPPPPVTRPPAVPPPPVLPAHWLGGERHWRRQPSVSA